MRSFVSELRRRNVLRVAAAYALVAWIFIEAGSVLLPTFGAPDWFFATVYVPVAIGGFVVAMIIAWIFEVTPEGVRLESEVDRTTYEPPPRNRMNSMIIGLLVVALGVSLTFNLTGVRLGILRRFQAIFYALAFSQLDGFAVPAPAQVTQTVGLPKNSRNKNHSGVRESIPHFSKQK